MIRLRWAAALAALSLTTAACGMGGGDDDGNGNTGSGGSGASTDGHLVYDHQFLPDAAYAVETDDAFILTNIGCGETLVRYATDGSLQPGLAESWEQSSPKEWTITLRSGVTFQDGTPMDAQTVVDALNHVLEAPTPARSFNPDVVTSVEASDDATVVVTTAAPDVLLPYRLASPNTVVLAPKAYAKKAIDIVGTCTGPFTVTAVNGRQSVDLERNDDYWGTAPKLATAEVRFVADAEARVTQLQTGEAQIVDSIAPSSKATLEGDDNLEILELQLPRTTSLLVNNSKPPFDDPTVREALRAAIDTDAIAQSIYEGAAGPAVGPFSPDDPWAPEDAAPVTADPEEAQRLLDEAGVDPSELSFELIAYNDRPEFGDLAAVIQDQLSQIGVDVKIRAGEYASFEPALLSGDFDAALLSRGYLVDVGDPAGYLTSDFTCDGGYNIAHYCNEETDAMIQEAVTVADAEERYAQYAEIGAKLQEEAAGIFLVHNSAQNAIASDVEGYEIHPLAFYTMTPELSVG
jgi:peptide/nickel transport system substrate-binding protein